MDSTELLFDVFQNAEVAREVIGRMIKSCEDGDMRKTLAEHFAGYHSVCEDAKAGLYERGRVPKPISAARKCAMLGSMRFNLRIDKTPSHMAEMLMQGSLLGIIDISKSLRINTHADDYSKYLANKIIEMEMSNIHRLRAYL